MDAARRQGVTRRWRPRRAIFGWAVHAQQISACIQRQIQARRALCSAPVLPYSGCRREGRSAFEKPILSDTLKASRQVWNEESLDRWLADPEKFAPGQRMGLSVPDAKERRDLIAYLKKATATAK